MAIDTDSILSFSAPLRLGMRVEAAPSAAFELVQVLLRLSFPASKTRHLDFIRELQLRRAELVEQVKALQAGAAADTNWHDTILTLLLLTAHGYARSADAQPFLDDLPVLVKRATPLFRSELECDLKQASPEERQEAEPMGRALLNCLEALQKRSKLEPYLKLLQAVWDELRPLWQEQGYKRISSECDRINAELSAGSGLLTVLPEHHHLKTEAFQSKFERYGRDGSVRSILLTPLYFISGGGHHFSIGGELFIGFGLEDERVRQKRQAFAQDLAGRMKALADPTRVMILSLICDFSKKLTVSDLASQFDLTQPTVSGHLKLLKEAGLVTLTKKGTKAYYSADPKAIESLLEELRDFVMPWSHR